MKAIVFDNAGTIIKRVTALIDMSTNNLIFESNTIDIVNQNDDNLILVFQTPTTDLIQIEGKIIDYIKSNLEKIEIAYSKKDYSKKDIIKALQNDTTTFSTIKKSATELVNKYNIEICSGSALIINIKESKIKYAYTSGGLFFEDTLTVFNILKKLNYSIYIASGDNKQSLTKIAYILNIDKNNVYDTCNVSCKKEIVKKLQKKYDQVIMVGNNTNDYKAIEQSNIGIITLEQGEELPDYLITAADYTIKKLGDLLKIVE